MSMEDDMRALADVLDFPPGDPRAFGCDMLMDLARHIDAGRDTRIPGYVHGAAWAVRYIVRNITESPNAPPTFVDELCMEHVSRYLDGIVHDRQSIPPPLSPERLARSSRPS